MKTDMIYDQVFPATIIPTNINPEYVITNHYTRMVPVRIQGKGKNLIVLRNTDINVLVDLNQSSRRKLIVRLNLKDVRISPPIGGVLPLEFVEKDTLHFILDPLRYKKVPVRCRVSIKPKAGYIQVGALAISPAEITVSGPESRIRLLKQVDTEEIHHSDVMADVSGTVSLVNRFPGFVTFSSRQVSYSANIQELGEKVLEDVPVRVTHVPQNLRVSIIPSTLSLKISGGVDVLSGIDREDIFAYIDFQRYDRRKKNPLPATIKIPDDITFSDVFPRLFQIKIE